MTSQGYWDEGGGGVVEKRHILSQMIPAATLRACYSYKLSAPPLLLMSSDLDINQTTSGL